MDSTDKEKLIIALCLLDLGLEAYINNIIEADYKAIAEELSDSLVGATSRLYERYKSASIYDKPQVLNELKIVIVPRIKQAFESYQALLNQKNAEISLAFPEVFELIYGEGFQNAKNFEENLLFGKSVSDWFESSAQNLAGSVVTSLSNDGKLGGVEESFKATLPAIEFVTDGLIRQTANNAELAFFLANEEAFPKLQFVAVMDNRTSKICRGLNGKVFPIGLESIPTPPLHPRCRSRLVPLFGKGIDFPTFNEFLGMLHQKGKIDLIQSILGKTAFDVYAKDKFTSLNFYTTQKFKSTEDIVSLIREGIS